MNAQFSVLDQVRVASPCQVSWDEMQGDDRRRFCSHCRLNVYNLSEMSREDAEAFVTKSEGRTCIRFFQRADGTMITRDCPEGLRAVRQRLARMFAGVGMILAGLLLGGVSGRVLAASGPIQNPPRFVQLLQWLGLRQPSPPSCVMGDVAPIPVPVPIPIIDEPIGGEPPSSVE